jgi:hypothetical protein
MEYHYSKEFVLFSYLRQLNNLLILFLLIGNTYFFAFVSPLFGESFSTIVLQDLATVAVLNIFILIFIQLIIINFCNPKMKLNYLQTFAQLGLGAVTLTGTVGGLHTVFLSPEAPDLPIVHTYQTQHNKYWWHDRLEL